MSIQSLLPEMNLENKSVILRADLNVPLLNGRILNDYRLKAILPTIQLIQKKGGRIILMTHIGRPKKAESSLSTRALIPWFNTHGLEIAFAPNLEQLPHMSKTNNIVLFENVRFFPEEKKQDKEFAKKLAQCGDYYINDAFATLHRKDSSIWLLPQFFDRKHRSIGLLIEKEIAMLDKLIKHPQKPFLLIIGGGKVADKLPLLQHLLDHVTSIMLCPAIVFTFLKALKKPVGKSLIDHSAHAHCLDFLDCAQKKGVEIFFPLDYQIARENLHGPLEIVDADNFPENGIGISIGHKTIQAWFNQIVRAKTIFFNAAMGFSDRPETLTGTYELLKALTMSTGYKVIGGGDSVAAAQALGIENQIDYLSTGGGATLTYLSGENLPGLEVLQK